METELIEFDGWTLRTKNSTAQNPKLLVLIHGWTGDENSMWVFARKLAPQYWMIAPRAPYPAEPSGFSWRPPQPELFGRPSLEALKPSVEALIRLIDEYAASVKLDARQFDAVGFSQGGAMVNALGALYPQRVRKMGVLAGFVPYQMEEIIQSKPLVGKNIFVAHGTQDEMVTIKRAYASMDLLKQAGATVTYFEDAIGHKMSASGVKALKEYLED
ncbi:MAG: alpha/beta fold hydrolase [Anaerolineales bacterium]|nr:alpha/beta fold hydrolase [Anaerolineales bacterium]MCZ2122318.1 alpha/beta fold hydrolase [Anaerolineales bacterium]